MGGRNGLSRAKPVADTEEEAEEEEEETVAFEITVFGGGV
jgi:hypothetical protein